MLLWETGLITNKLSVILGHTVHDAVVVPFMSDSTHGPPLMSTCSGRWCSARSPWATKAPPWRFTTYGEFWHRHHVWNIAGGCWLLIQTCLKKTSRSCANFLNVSGLWDCAWLFYLLPVFSWLSTLNIYCFCNERYFVFKWKLYLVSFIWLIFISVKNRGSNLMEDQR